MWRELLVAVAVYGVDTGAIHIVIDRFDAEAPIV
jgi:hypothetical protein